LEASGLLAPLQLKELTVTPGHRYWTEIVRRGYATDQQIVETIAKRFRVGTTNLSDLDPRVVPLLPENVARKYLVVPLGANDREIRIATADPRDVGVEQTLAFVAGRDVAFSVAPPDRLAEKLDELYRPENAVNRLVGGLEPASVETIAEDPTPSTSRNPSWKRRWRGWWTP
jgi:type IV pilus assembly protein PilB